MNKAQKSGRQKDVIVSVRLPRSLVDELRDIQKINHFLDLSDEIRFIVRKYCLKFMSSENNSPSIEEIAEQKRKEQLIAQLSSIIDSLKDGKSQGEKKDIQ